LATTDLLLYECTSASILASETNQTILTAYQHKRLQGPSSQSVEMQATATSDGLATSPLGKLPPELRLIIYDFAITLPESIDIWLDPTWVTLCREWKSDMRKVRRALRMMAVCRQLWQETRPIIYGSMSFRLWAGVVQGEDQDDLIKPRAKLLLRQQSYAILGWLSQLGACADHLRNVEIFLGTFVGDCPMPPTQTMIPLVERFGTVLKSIKHATTVVKFDLWRSWTYEDGIDFPVAVCPKDSKRTRDALETVLKRQREEAIDEPLGTMSIEEHEEFFSWVEELLQSLLERYG